MTLERLTPQLRTKNIYKLVVPEDGYRISVMSRHTLNDGITPDPFINSKSFDSWMKELAPAPKLIGSYYKRGLNWNDFEKEYLEFLKNPEQTSKILEIIGLALTQRITLLCIEETPEYCHRRLLAEECKRINPDLVLTVH